jgi:uncharacterized protein (TIGR02118 family)
MAGVELVVIYPRPKDIESFERVYLNEHVPMAVEKLAGKTRIVANKILGAPQRTPQFHRIGEIDFPTMKALEARAASEGGKQTIANAVAISSQGRTDFPARGRGSICVLADQPRMTAVMITPADRKCLVIHSLVGNISLRGQFSRASVQEPQ